MMWAQWDWNRPVLLTRMPAFSLFVATPLEKVFEMQWNPLGNLKDRQHLMPIITPVFPCLNSSHKVLKSTLRVLTKEFAQAFRVLSSCSRSNSLSNGNPWAMLLSKPVRFFYSFDIYLELEMSCADLNLVDWWARHVFHKLTLLTASIETHDYIWPRPLPFIIRSSCKKKRYVYIGIDADAHKYMRDAVNSNTSKKHENDIVVDISSSTSSFAQTVGSSFKHRNRGMDLVGRLVEIDPKSAMSRTDYFPNICLDLSDIVEV